MDRGAIEDGAVSSSTSAPRQNLVSSLPQERRETVEIPAHVIPTAPSTVSPELADYMKRTSPSPKEANASYPSTQEGWRDFFRNHTDDDPARIPGVLTRYGVTLEQQEIAGVNTYLLTPNVLPANHKNRLFVALHGGAYMGGRGLAGLSEAILYAHYTQTQVLEIDYRMPPEHPFPAAIDDMIAVWKELTKTRDPKRMALVGASAGGNAALAVTQRIIQENLPRPAAIAVCTPWADLSGASDSYKTLDLLDMTCPPAALDAAAREYAGSIPLDDARVSPLYGSFSGFPPSILITGTRDLLLSDTVRAEQKIRVAGAETKLIVFEAQRHADYMLAAIWGDSEPPETREAFEALGKFFDAYLAQ